MARSSGHTGRMSRSSISYMGDVDLEAKLQEWERFYNLARPHGAHNGKTPYEALRAKL